MATIIMEDNLLSEEEYLMEGCISNDDGQPLKTIIDMKDNGQKLILVPKEDEVLTRCEEEGRTEEEMEFVEKWLAVDMEDKGHINFTDSVEEKKQIKIPYSSGIKEERLQQSMDGNNIFQQENNSISFLGKQKRRDSN